MSALVGLLWLPWLLGFGTGCNRQIRVVGNVPANELPEIREAVNRELLKRWGSVDGRPLKSIEITTNNSYWQDLHLVATFEGLAQTNPTVKARLEGIRSRVRSRLPNEATNLAVCVWYADTAARWGEAGFGLEKKEGGWSVFTELFR